MIRIKKVAGKTIWGQQQFKDLFLVSARRIPRGYIYRSNVLKEHRTYGHYSASYFTTMVEQWYAVSLDLQRISPVSYDTEKEAVEAVVSRQDLR